MLPSSSILPPVKIDCPEDCNYRGSLKCVVSHLGSKHNYTQFEMKQYRENRKHRKIISEATIFYKCLICSKVLKSSAGMKYHMMKTHGFDQNTKYTRCGAASQKTEKVSNTPAKFRCHQCELSFLRALDLCQHLAVVHTLVHFMPEEFAFANVEQFEIWLYRRMQETCTTFNKRSGYSTIKGVRVEHFHCTHFLNNSMLNSPSDGNEQPYNLCTSFMKVMIDENQCVTGAASFQHSGHEIDWSGLSFSEEEKEKLYMLVSRGMSNEWIMHTLKKTEHINSRIYHTSVGDLRKIRNKLRREKMEVEYRAYQHRQQGIDNMSSSTVTTVDQSFSQNQLPAMGICLESPIPYPPHDQYMPVFPQHENTLSPPLLPISPHQHQFHQPLSQFDYMIPAQHIHYNRFPDFKSMDEMNNLDVFG